MVILKLSYIIANVIETCGYFISYEHFHLNLTQSMRQPQMTRQ